MPNFLQIPISIANLSPFGWVFPLLPAEIPQRLNLQIFCHYSKSTEDTVEQRVSGAHYSPLTTHIFEANKLHSSFVSYIVCHSAEWPEGVQMLVLIICQASRAGPSNPSSQLSLSMCACVCVTVCVAAQCRKLAIDKRCSS